MQEHTEDPRHRFDWLIFLFLFLSGFSALVYQVSWMKLFRLLFGCSTPATACVLAVFMGGLGVGGIVIGKRADRTEDPLRLYAILELLISLSAILSLLLFAIGRHVYLATGGSMVLGTVGATICRILIAVIVMGLPTFLMGGTLPVAMRYLLIDRDESRAGVGWGYGLNTVGAVIGTLLTTFYLLEHLGTRSAFVLACSLNALIGAIAYILPNSTARVYESSEANCVEEDAPRLILFATFVSGFSFFLMELVWYRLLAPVLGGTTFTFGTILAVTLAGIGIGGVLYGLLSQNKRFGLVHFAFYCAIQAICLSYPFAIGDEFPIFLAFNHPKGASLFIRTVWWCVSAAVVILPAAILSGFIFPLLISLLGTGKKSVGKHIGLLNAVNTLGAILGSLAGGFLLLPLFTATGCWQLCGFILIVLAIIMLAASRCDTNTRAIGFYESATVLCTILAVVFITSTGPTMTWRYSSVGYYRHDFHENTPNSIKKSANNYHRNTVIEFDGREAAVGLRIGENGYNFIVNGKCDGSARSDAPAQIWTGLLGTLLHPKPQKTFVVGLGTGTTAGWLAQVDTVEKVDVAEIEPKLAIVAKYFSPVNYSVMENPKVNLMLTDAREILLTTDNHYDVIASEPSNPYRMGIASLYTLEFYQEVTSRLTDNGIFVQWLQCYNMDDPTMLTIYATLKRVFEYVESWELESGSVAFVCSQKAIRYNEKELRKRLKFHPYRKALNVGYRVDSLEGLLAHYVASDKVSQKLSMMKRAKLNTDNRTLLEYGCGRNLGLDRAFRLDVLRYAASRSRDHRPPIKSSTIDWERVEDLRAIVQSSKRHEPTFFGPMPLERKLRFQAIGAYVKANFADCLNVWMKQKQKPRGPMENLLIALCLVQQKEDPTILFDEFKEIYPTETIALQAMHLTNKKSNDAAFSAYNELLTRIHDDPWVESHIMRSALGFLYDFSLACPRFAPKVFALLARPFPARIIDHERVDCRIRLALRIGAKETVEALTAFEPIVPWTEATLLARYFAYSQVNHPLTKRAEAELFEFMQNEEEPNFLDEYMKGPKKKPTLPKLKTIPLKSLFD